jgi:peptidyl-prolyl cis-trans isomerase C
MNDKKHTIAILTVLAVGLMLSSCRGDISKSSQVLARVGDKEITNTYFERQLSDLPESVRDASMQGEGKRAALEGMVNREVLYAQAVAKKVDRDVELNRKFDDLKKELIVKTYLENQLGGKIKVEDSEVVNYYNNNPSEYQHREEVRISQIVVPDEATAAQMLEKLSIKREFGELAAANSIDKGSAARQGDVGWFTMQKLPPEIRESVFRLQEGEVSKPYKMQGRYEIYKITERRSSSIPLEKVKDMIRVQLFNEKSQKEVKKLVDGLKKTTVVQVNEQLLK